MPSKEQSSVRAVKDGMDSLRPTLVGFFKDDQDPVYKTYIEVRMTLTPVDSIFRLTLGIQKWTKLKVDLTRISFRYC